MLVSYEIKLNIVLKVLKKEHAKLCVTNVKPLLKNMKVLWNNVKHVLDCKFYGKIVGQFLLSLT